MLTQSVPAPVVPLPSSTVPREQFDRMRTSRNFYERLYVKALVAQAAQCAESHRLRRLLVAHGINPESQA